MEFDCHCQLNPSNNQWEELPPIPFTLDNQLMSGPDMVKTATCHNGSLLCLNVIVTSFFYNYTATRMYVEYNPAGNRWYTVGISPSNLYQTNDSLALAADSGENVYYIANTIMTQESGPFTTKLRLNGFSNDYFTQATVNNAGDLYLIVKKDATNPYIIVKAIYESAVPQFKK